MTKFAKATAFAWAIAFARWPILKMVSFLEYLVFFGAVFSQTNYNVVVESVFSCFLHFLILTQNDYFFKGYSLCKMGDFQNGFISRTFNVFWSGFLHRPTIMLL